MFGMPSGDVTFRYALKVAQDAPELLKRESESLHLTSRFKDLLGRFVQRSVPTASVLSR
jgi:hypothetical protein